MPNGMQTPVAPQGNALQRPTLSPVGQRPTGPNVAGTGFNVAAHVQNNWQQAQVQHKQLLDSQKRMDSVRRELDSLGKLGDTVTVEDVIKGAGTLVGSGFSPMAVAQMLSSMPTTGGQALQAWIAQQEQNVQGMEAQLRQKVVSSSVHRGITAMAALHVDHIKGKLQQGQQMGAGAPQMGGALAPQGQPSPAPSQGEGAGEEEA